MVSREASFHLRLSRSPSLPPPHFLLYPTPFYPPSRRRQPTLSLTTMYTNPHPRKSPLFSSLPGCMTNNYNPAQIQTCLPSRRLVFIGDSITRQLFYSMAKLADPTAPDGPPEGGEKHSDALWKSAKGKQASISRFGRGSNARELKRDGLKKTS